MKNKSDIASITEIGIFLAVEFTLAFMVRLFGGNMMENVIFVAAFTAIYIFRNPLKNGVLYIFGQAILALTFGFSTFGIIFSTIPAALIGIIIGLSFRKNKIAIGILIGLVLSSLMRAFNIFVYDNYILGLSYSSLVKAYAEIAELFIKIINPNETFDNIYHVNYILYSVFTFIILPIVDITAISLVLNWTHKKVINRIRRI